MGTCITACITAWTRTFLAVASSLALFIGLSDSYADDGYAGLTPQQFRQFRGQVTDAGQYVGSLQVQQYRFSGKLGGCGLVFNVVLRDWAHAPEALTYAIGSISYFAKADQAPYLATKLVIDDIREMNGEVQMTPANAQYSYLRTEEMSLAGTESIMTFDEDGHSLLGAYADPDGALLSIFAKPSIRFAYNRGDSGADVEFVLHTSDTRIGNELPMCMIELISSIEKRSQ